MFGKVEDNNDSYYTSEQIALLMAVDPDFQDKYEKEQDLKKQIDYEKLKEKSDKFDQRMPLDGSTANMLDLDYGESEKSGEGIRPPNGSGVCAPNGGALPALIPIAAKVVAPLAVKGIFKGIKWIIKKIKNKKKKKQEQQQQSGSGICAPNGGAIYNTVMDYIKKHNPQFNKFSNDLMRMKSKQAWRNILKYGKNITRDILKDYVDNDFDRSQLNKKIKRSFNKMIPYKFKRMIKTDIGNPNSFIEKERRLNNFSLAKPVIKYGINEIAGSGPISKKAYKESLKHIMNNYGYYGNGKISWKKIRKLTKYGLSKGLQFLKNFGDRFINGDKIKDIVTNILNNFEVLRDLGINDEIGDMSQKLVKRGYDTGYNKIQEKLKDDDYDDVDKQVNEYKDKAIDFKDKYIDNGNISDYVSKKLNKKQRKRLKSNSVSNNNSLFKSKEDAIFGNGKYSKNSKSPAVRFVIK